MRGKRIPTSFYVGQQGINLIEQIILKMRFNWTPRSELEAGIDGFIEVCNPNTGEALNEIIQVQSKARSGRFTAETESNFEWLCSEEDIEYWLLGNAPVILVVSRPDTKEAYWVSVKEYFSSPESRLSRRILFDKVKNRFDESCKHKLLNLAIPNSKGIYLAPQRKRELLHSNLLEVTLFSPKMFVAHIKFGSIAKLKEELLRLTDIRYEEWLLKESKILSFHNLSEFPWNEIVDIGTIEDFDSVEWAYSEEEDRRRDFVHLLNMALKVKVMEELDYSERKECYFFRATPDLSPKKIGPGRGRTVFQAYKYNKTKFCRHSAFKGQFKLFTNRWYLEITPTYHYTWDGFRIDKFYYEDRLSTQKRLERNNHVLAQLLMWERYLTKPSDFFSVEYPFLRFGRLHKFELNFGINDDYWLGHEEDEEKSIMTNPLTKSLF